MTEIVLFKTAVVIYLTCAIVYGASLWVRRVLTARIATWLMLAAFAVHTVALAFRWISAGQTPVIGIHDALSFFSWVMAAV